MRHAAIHVCLIIVDWVSSCLFHSAAIQLSAHKKPAVRIVSERSGTSVQFPQMASFSQAPLLSTSGAERRAESIIRCVGAAPSARPRWAVLISSDLFLHGSLILRQSPRLITMGTFHRVLDLINDFFSISCPPSSSCSPRLPLLLSR